MPPWYLGIARTSHAVHHVVSQLDKCELFKFMEKAIQWTDRNENHKVAWYTDKDYMIPYSYDAGMEHKPIEFPQWMNMLRLHISAHACQESTICPIKHSWCRFGR